MRTSSAYSMSAPMKKLTSRSLLLALLAFLVATGTAQPKEKDISLERQAATDLLTKLRDGLKAATGNKVELGQHPFHFVFLVDSSRSAMRSPETLFARNVIGQFLKVVAANEDARNVSIENRSLASIYPYQLDLYKSGSNVVQSVEVTPDGIAKVTDSVPQTYQPSRPNGKPYINDPNKRRYDGHDNVQPRRDLLDLVGPESRGRPTLLVQITTNPLNEAPTDPKIDAAIRAQQGRTGKLEGSGFEPYGMMQTASRHSPDAVQVHFWMYGPSPATWNDTIGTRLITHPARGAKPVQPNPKPPNRPEEPRSYWWIVLLILLGGLGGAALWWFMAKVPVVVEGVPATVQRGQELALVATASAKGSRAVVLPAERTAGAPAGDLAVLKLAGSEVQIEGRTCMVSVSGGSPKQAIPLKKGPAGNQITISVKGGFTSTIHVKVLG